jgi:hypothetical protein
VLPLVRNGEHYTKADYFQPSVLADNTATQRLTPPFCFVPADKIAPELKDMSR